jgi:hypothetical protein
MNVGATTQGDGIIALITTYGAEILVGAIALVLIVIGIACCRRTLANSRGNEKKF